MSNYKVQIPTLNSIQFVPVGEILPEKYHQYQLDKAWHKELIAASQSWLKLTQAEYQQPVQMTDFNWIQLHRTYSNSSDLQVLDCDGNVVYSEFITNNVFAPGHFDNGVDVWTNQAAVRFSDLDLDEGVYYI